MIEGHTSGDEDPTLAKARAEAVASYLKSIGVKADRIIDVAGYGSTRPLKQEITGKKVDEAARALNRHVDVRFIDAVTYTGGGGGSHDKDADERATS